MTNLDYLYDKAAVAKHFGKNHYADRKLHFKILEGATVVYLGLFYPVWRHCLTDNLRRLWFLQSDTFKCYFKDCAQIYLPWSNGEGIL